MTPPRVPPDSLTSLLTLDEGESLTAYQDTRGYWTISRGVCVDAKVSGAGLTPQESSWLALNRQSLAVRSCGETWPWFYTLSKQRQAVVASMAFQLGLAGLKGFPLFLEAVGKGEWAVAAAEMRDSLWAKQTPERAHRLAEQMETDQWV